MPYMKIGDKWYSQSGSSKFTQIKLHVNKDDGYTYSEDDDVVPVDALNFKSFAECADESPKDWLIEGVIALNEDSTWWGPSGALKSTLMAEIAVCIAAGRDWRGHRFTHTDEDDELENVNYFESRGVIIFATERAALTRRRLEAYKQRENLPADLPLVIVDATVNLMDPGCVNQISDTILSFEQHHDCKVGLVIFDTWSKCLGGCDEQTAQVQNYAASHLKKIRERHYSSFHCASVGHSGKNIAAGERGNSAKRASVDMAVMINGGVAKVEKANDLAEDFILATFEPEEFTVRGKYPDGQDRTPYKVSILSPYKPDQTVTEARTAAFQPLTGKQALRLDALRRAIAERGEDGAVHAEYWKEELTRAGLIKADDKNSRTTFKRIRDGLSQHIIEVEGLVRIIPQLEIPPPPIVCSVAA